MEIFELRYFACAARYENILRASDKLHVSAGSISKAIARLEAELGVTLFDRVGRNIRLTEHGRLLQRRAGQILALEEASRVEVSGNAAKLQVTLVGPEVFLAHFGVDVVRTVRNRFPGALCRLESTESEADALERIEQGQAQLAIVASQVPKSLQSQVLAQATFATRLGEGHPLYARAKTGRSISIENLLDFEFACPETGILGQLKDLQTRDGWRDDKYPRKIKIVSPNLLALCRVVQSGLALAHLPDYLATAMDLETVKVSGCPYVCAQTIRLVRESTSSTFDFLFTRGSVRPS